MESLDKLENNCQDTCSPLMNAWRYHHSTAPNTTAYNQAYDTIQLPAGYKWNIDFAKTCQDAVVEIMAKFWQRLQWSHDCQRRAALMGLSP